VDVGLIVAIVAALFVIIVLVKAVLVIPQAQTAVIERLGRFKVVGQPGLNFLVPFLDKVRARIDMREQVVSFPPQPVITQDNLTVRIDTVVYFQVTDSRSAVYEISNYIIAVEQLTTTTLRNVVGGMSLEQTLTSRDNINQQLRGVLDMETGRWGIRVARVELKAIDPPASIQDSMEKQMRADREKRAMILNAEGLRESSIKTAEGQKQSQILGAEGAKQAAILAAEAERQSRILRAQGDRAARYLQAQGQAKAIEKVKAARPSPEVLAYQYLQTLPTMAQGDANKVWLIPSDYGKALEGFARMLGAPGDDGVFRYEAPKDVPETAPEEDEESVKGWFDVSPDPKVAEAVRAAEEVARKEVGSPLSVPKAVGPSSAADSPALPAGEPEVEATQSVAPPSPPAGLPVTPPQGQPGHQGQQGPQGQQHGGPQQYGQPGQYGAPTPYGQPGQYGGPPAPPPGQYGR
jgi:regulator of protease activity HflC (stomatin/prohibitin superfamily)